MVNLGQALERIGGIIVFEFDTETAGPAKIKVVGVGANSDINDMFDL